MSFQVLLDYRLVTTCQRESAGLYVACQALVSGEGGRLPTDSIGCNTTERGEWT